MKKLLVFFLFSLVFGMTEGTIFARGEKELRSEHFIIRYEQGIKERYIFRIKEMGEKYYRKITQEFNLIRDKLWLWENRAQILIAKDKTDYLEKFSCPPWSGACVDYNRKIIYTFYGQEQFSSILAHELTHIIFREYVGSSRLPLWLDEGVAVFVEEKYGDKREIPLSVVKKAIQDETYIPFSELNKISALELHGQQTEEVTLFYIQAYSIISYLRNKFGRGNFSQFLFYLRRGSSLDDALGKGFVIIRNTQDLEKAWKKYYQR